MLVKAAKLALAAATLALFTTGADAQNNYQSRCARTKDPVKCRCFFANNGQIINSGGRRRAVIWGMGELDGYIACMKRNGRPEG